MSRKSFGLQAFLISPIVVVCSGTFAFGQAATSQNPSVPWAQISQVASDFVNRESPPNIFPFQVSGGHGTKQVFIHYFPFWVLSFDNKPTNIDYWSQNYDSETGSQAQYAKQGGFYRERPITPPPWDSPYWQQRNLAIDIFRAKKIGADGFFIDLPGIEGRAWDIAVSLCDVAAHVAPGFKIAVEPGMAGLKATIDPPHLAEALLTLNQCPAAYHLPDGSLLVAPFATELKPPDFWTQVSELTAAKGVKIALLPVFLNPAKSAQSFRQISVGVSYWGDGDATTVKGEPEQALLRSLSSMYPLLMEPVRPQDVRPKSSIFWEAQNTTLYRTMWQVAIKSNAQYVQPITWNDLSEGTELEPSSATQYLFYDLSAYYIDWYKSGVPPKVISDAIYYSSRNQIIELGKAPKPDQQPMRLLGKTPVNNNIEMLAFLTAPSMLQISIGDKTYKSEAKPGMAVFSVPASFGQPKFAILRSGKVVASVAAHYVISPNPGRENPIYYGGSSNRSVVDLSNAQSK